MGVVIDKNLIEKGDQADDSLKKIDTQIKAITANLAPAISKIGEFGEATVKYLGPGFKKLSERIFGDEVKGNFFKSVDELLAYSKKMATIKPELPSIDEEPVNRERIHAAVASIFEEIDALNVLGVVSERFY